MRFHAFDKSRVTNRDPKYQQADIAAVRAMVQAAINVELFTIPLYMTSMYSIQGLHQINASGTDFYQGRWWPGAAAQVEPQDANGQVFNLIFRVFIEEMLHLQLAANAASILGFKPVFTSPALQSERGAWTCYQGTVIPHVLDFKDVKEDSVFKGVQVQLQAMNAEQAKLFLAIEETAEAGEKNLNNPTITYPDGTTGPKYFEEAPFNWFTADMGENDLPLFGSIGHMYKSLWSYLEITYDDADQTSLLDLLLQQPEVGEQRDQFNQNAGYREYPGVNATLARKDTLMEQLINIIDAITDQGEGRGVVPQIRQRWNRPVLMRAVSGQFQVNAAALEHLYPGYDDQGNRLPISGPAFARIHYKDLDHYECFEKVQSLIQDPAFQTWDQWHANPENRWTAAMLNPENTPSKYNIPSAQAVADALNNLKTTDPEENFKSLSLAAVGTIRGITSQLDQFWLTDGKVTQFPSPAMYGSGDRLSICWAIIGKTPDLALPLESLEKGVMFHACQGMSLMGSTFDPDAQPDVRIFHSCKGSNACRTQGGCGFVQNSQGGGNCSQSVAKPEAGCGLQTMSAPANNKCSTFGGCAVPISASQLFPAAKEGDSYVMQLFNFGPAPNFPSEPLETMAYAEGDAVYDVAWRAYREVQAARGVTVPEDPPPASDMRLAFPPST
ncbi:ferritin-like domain-containing protein [Acanthopleuribacter pedis]|uniref:Iminophenyl-pyruvate dimer synthase domain-containing protein n=1 Tax=Acanthopleuribacter pedis TaxID=442870 RepID=A0A8J7QE37_9BACT|nr:ferritin-like domain-containing protein [Acanthopleuribacter pedis]MBO1322887.1 hypothetical protein [Acanthopleuribacter pedis]